MNKEESFEGCMERLFGTNKYQGINRLDLFKILFDDQAKKIEAYRKDNKEMSEILSRVTHKPQVQIIEILREAVKLENENEELELVYNNLLNTHIELEEENKNLIAALKKFVYLNPCLKNFPEYQAIKHLLEED